MISHYSRKVKWDLTPKGPDQFPPKVKAALQGIALRRICPRKPSPPNWVPWTLWPSSAYFSYVSNSHSTHKWVVGRIRHRWVVYATYVDYAVTVIAATHPLTGETCAGNREWRVHHRRWLKDPPQ